MSCSKTIANTMRDARSISHFISLLCFLCLKIESMQTTPTGVPSNEGTNFFIAFSKNVWQDESLRLLVTTLNSGNSNFMVTSPSHSYSFVGSVHNGTIVEVVIPASFELQSSTDRQKGIWIQSTDNQTKLSVFVLKSGTLVSGGYLALPSHVYENVQEYTYYGVSYPNDGRLDWDTKSGILLVGSYNNTRVTISPSQRIAIPVDLRNPVNYRSFINRGESYTFTMHSLQTFSFESLQDLTGTKVATNKPMTVITSHECADVPSLVPYCDHIVEQVPPTVTWGRFFLVTSLHTRLVGERYRIVASKSSTRVIVRCIRSGQILPETNTTSLVFNYVGETREFPIGPRRYCSIQATKPVMVIQFSTGYSLDQIGDPFILYVPPAEQYSNNITVHAPSDFPSHISVVVPVRYFNPAQIYIRGVTIPSQSWSPIFCSSSHICGYGTKLGIATGVNYVYHSDPEARIGVFAYGFEYHSAYGYPAGMELKQIADVCVHGAVRLVPTSPSLSSLALGRVEVCLSGAWSVVCGGGWGIEDANVVCSQLGYASTDVTAYTDEPPASVISPPFLFTNSRCTGTESRLTHCSHTSGISECASGKIAFTLCESLPAPTITVRSDGPIQLRSSLSIVCTVQLSFDLWSTSQVQLSWSKDDVTLQNTSRIMITPVSSVNEASTYYQSNVSVSGLGEADSGEYTCTASVILTPRSHQITSTGIGAIFLTIQPTSNQLIQLRLIGVGDCGVWLYEISNPTEKVSQVINAIIDNTENLCPSGACGFAANHFTESAFQCFTQNAHEVTFRTNLHETSQASIMELVNAILEWMDTGATMSVNGVLLIADATCHIAIGSFSEPECHSGNITTTEPVTGAMTTTVQVTSKDPRQTLGHGQPINMEAIIGGSVAVIVVLICAILIAVISIACLCTRHKSRSAHQFPRETISAVSPFPPPAYGVGLGPDQIPSAQEEKEKVPPDYTASEEQYWKDYEVSVQPVSTTV